MFFFDSQYCCQRGSIVEGLYRGMDLVWFDVCVLIYRLRSVLAFAVWLEWHQVSFFRYKPWPSRS